MDFPLIVYPVAVVSVGLVCACLYVYDLRSQVKKQANIIREQNSKLNPTTQAFQDTHDSNRAEGSVSSLTQVSLDAEQALFARACEYLELERPFTNPDLRMEDLARSLNTNRTTLGYCVRKYSRGHVTTQQLVTRFRLRYAEQLLTDKAQEMNVAEVAEAAGFNSRSTFNRQFFQMYGSSPTDYRELALSHKDGVVPSSRENTLEK